MGGHGARLALQRGLALDDTKGRSPGFLQSIAHTRTPGRQVVCQHFYFGYACYPMCVRPSFVGPTLPQKVSILRLEGVKDMSHVQGRVFQARPFMYFRSSRSLSEVKLLATSLLCAMESVRAHKPSIMAT